MAAKKKLKPSAALREFALSLPEAWEDYPWGEAVIKVRKKVFVFFGVGEREHGVFLCVKLPNSATEVLAEPWAEPAGYGLGKADWVYIKLERDRDVHLATARGWILESYRAVAPKTLVKRLETR